MAKTNDIQEKLADSNAEAATLGAIIGNASLLAVIRFLTPEMFFYTKHAHIYRAMLRIARRGDAIDLTTTEHELQQAGHLEAVGGMDYLMKLHEFAHMFSNLESYARIVERLHARRELIKAADEIRAQAFAGDVETSGLIAASLKRIEKISLTDADGSTHISALISRVYDKITAGEQKPSVPCGLESLTNHLGGWFSDDLTIIAGRPGMGKSSLCLSMANNIAMALQMQGDNRNVLFVTVEMKDETLIERLWAGTAEIVLSKIKDVNRQSPQESSRFIGAMDLLVRLPLYFKYQPALTTVDLGRIITQHQMTYGKAAIVFIDGLYTMKSVQEDGRRFNNKHEEVTQIVSSLKRMAQNFSIPFVVTHQLNREIERRQDKRPTAADLRESGSLEEWADYIIGLYQEGEASGKSVVELILLKARHAQRGTLYAYFDRAYTRYLDAQVTEVNLQNL